MKYLPLILFIAVFSTIVTVQSDAAPIAWEGTVSDYHGYTCHDFTVDGCGAHVVEPKSPLPGNPWIWRALFWDAYPSADLALLNKGYYLAYIEVGNTFGCPEALAHFDVFYSLLTNPQYKFSKKPALEGLSRGGLYVYRWAMNNTDKVGCIYGDAPVCDMNSWPGGYGIGAGSKDDWQTALSCYHFTHDIQLIEFKGNPIDILQPIAAAHIPIIHVVGDSDHVVPEVENTDILRERYLALGGEFVLIVKRGCDHHPHELSDPTPVVNFIMAKTAGGKAEKEAKPLALKSGTITYLNPGQWTDF